MIRSLLLMSALAGALTVGTALADQPAANPNAAALLSNATDEMMVTPVRRFVYYGYPSYYVEPYGYYGNYDYYYGPRAYYYTYRPGYSYYPRNYGYRYYPYYGSGWYPGGVYYGGPRFRFGFGY
ncbi:MAG: hypothetical protein LLG00_14240 [Planctomycetaceae bacterium]|nr:hypothetical protein [Planctomycetaceae bacterium]